LLALERRIRIRMRDSHSWCPAVICAVWLIAPTVRPYDLDARHYEHTRLLLCILEHLLGVLEHSVLTALGGRRSGKPASSFPIPAFNIRPHVYTFCIAFRPPISLFTYASRRSTQFERLRNALMIGHAKDVVVAATGVLSV
jgi:hypothetical protein